ncbi:hypothetical protein AN963_19015 [Brevibacillus choshinensis]|uniref:N-acetyltransferase domain-containing protein n=1 Tax=Brevibacillus choshinensis TaxID=54911 RepID=A0ABR5N8J3_BRECH|nr:hypothetical protein [Brevibacillus choshinensis]KQL46948.1 hypothetical protein AN963_19015 [Brevibacillus choshinensis]
MIGKFRRCVSDEDYAQFALYFIRHRKEFHSQFSLNDTLVHILETIQNSRIILVEDHLDNMIGWVHYHYYNADYQDDSTGEIAFVNSVIIAEQFRSSRIFLQGFRYLVNQIAEESQAIKLFQFCALEENAYLNRLYAKFAQPIGKREGYNGIENIFSTEFQLLLSYLNRANMSN